MKKLFTIALALFFGAYAYAQIAVETTLSIKKNEIPGFSINVPNADSKSAMTAIQEYLTEKGLVKPKKDDKYMSFKSQKFSYFGNDTYDIYFNAVQKGNKKNMSSDINIICSLGNLNAISSTNNAETAANIQAFMAKFPKVVEKYMLKQKIESLKKEAEKAKKEKAKNDKALKKLQDQIEKSTKNQNNLNKQIEENSKMLQNFNID